MMEQEKMQKRLELWLRLDRFKDRQERNLAIILYSIEAVNAFVTGMVTIAFFVRGSANAVNAAVSFVITLGLFGLTALGSIGLVRWLLPLVTFVVTAISMQDSGGISGLAVFILPAIIAMAGLLLQCPGVIIFTILDIIAILWVGNAQMRGASLPMAEELVTRMTVMSILLVLVGAIQYLIIVILESNTQEANAHREALVRANQELSEAKESLEVRIEERTQRIEAARLEAETARQYLEAQAWQAGGQAQLSDIMRGDQDISELADHVIHYLAKFIEANVGALFVMQDGFLKMMGSYAYTYRKGLSDQFEMGEGLVGQAALEKQMITIRQIPEDYMATASGLVKLAPRVLLAAPVMAGGNVVGVIELGKVDEFSAEQVEFLEKALESIGLAFSTSQARTRVNELLAQTQLQAQELKLREEELSVTNNELQQQTQALSDSQQRLVTQQAALEAANAELEERASILQDQQVIVDRQNQELKAAQLELEKRAEELSLASKYKSEFLANMSHELRTPLNSLLILANMLAKNETGNLTQDQIEAAQIIFTSGSDLLTLINDILDLSKVEAGQMQFNLAPVSLYGLIQTMRAQFAPIAQSKGLNLDFFLAEGLPETIETDQQRVQQVVKNLLSNALKFTEKGFVRLRLEHPGPEVDLSGIGLNPFQAVAIHVEDSGIGMTREQQKVVFEAFQQADGSTSRKYGGTGLGLAISRELIHRLGGRIEMHSEPGEGSIFSVYLPMKHPVVETAYKQAEDDNREIEQTREAGVDQDVKSEPTLPSQAVADWRNKGLAGDQESLQRQMPYLQDSVSIPDDRNDLHKSDKVLLIIEDDPIFARVVYQHAHKRDFKCLIAGDGESGLRIVEIFCPDAILLDLKLPGMSGWQVLDILKQNPYTRHIPVHILSAMEENLDAYKMGAIGFLSKPVNPDGLEEVFRKLEEYSTQHIKSLLIVEDDDSLRHSVRQLLGGSDIRIVEASRGKVALELLQAQHFDCMILDLNLPDINGFDLLNQMNEDDSIKRCPVIIYTGKALTEDENNELMKYAESVIIKGVKSPERLLDETALFLHRVVADMPEEKQTTIKRLHQVDSTLVGKHILIVEDDMRSAFALSKLLTEKSLKVNIARSGQKALEFLDTTPGLDLVLMDIMMPEMDGYETIRRIRAQNRFCSLPILALTAKAMKGDREKCLVAGANDYLSKPVDVDRLFSMLRVWLYR
jgi:CheY-like chemotaxis protein